MRGYFPRVIESIIHNYLQSFSVVGITGPRQSGKSTTLNEVFSEDYTYITFDDFKNVELFYDDPVRFMNLYSDKVIFDEVQRVPEIFNYIKIAVDNDRDNYGKYIITGSSQFSFHQKITESLAGRIGLIPMLPLQYKEIPPSLRSVSQFKGCYPEVVKKKYLNSKNWYSSYLNTYIERDVRSLINIGDLSDFRKLIILLAANTSQILNVSELSRDIGVSVKTIQRWISVLEASYIVFRIHPYFKNLGKRLIKSPKLYFYDTGLVSFLTGISTTQLYENGPMAGSIFENYVVSEILKKLRHEGQQSALYYIRTSNGLEVDLIIDKGISKDLIEIKKSETFRVRMIKPIQKMMEENDMGYLLFDGEATPFDNKIQIMNYTEFLSN
jgi:predicted AAA+ superfamily ATPase